MFQMLARKVALNTDNGSVIYVSTDDPAKKIYDNILAQITGLPRDYCSNPFFHKFLGMNSDNPEKETFYDLYLHGRQTLFNLLDRKKLIVLDVNSKIDNWNALQKALTEICSYSGMDKMYKVLIIDSVNKIQVDGINTENEAVSFLSSNIKKLGETLNFMSFLNFELNKNVNNARLSQYNLSGTKRIFYDSDVLGFLYNPTKNLEGETQMKWELETSNGVKILQPILFSIQEKTKCGNNQMTYKPYFYKLNEFTSELTPIELGSLEHNKYYDLWKYEFFELYQ